MTDHRRVVLTQVLDRLAPAERGSVVQALRDFSSAAEIVLRIPHAHLP